MQSLSGNAEFERQCRRVRDFDTARGFYNGAAVRSSENFRDFPGRIQVRESRELIARARPFPAAEHSNDAVNSNIACRPFFAVLNCSVGDQRSRILSKQICMQKKTLNLALAAILIGVFVFLLTFGDNEDQEVVRQLARKQRQFAASVSPDATVEKRQPESLRLTAALTAKRKDMRGYWVVQHEQSSSFVELPFRPNSDGALPNGALPNGESEGESILTPDSSSNPGFMGASACAECHKEQHDGFIHTAHHKTSGKVEPGNRRGHFTEPRNTLKTRDRQLFFTMKQREDRYLQEVSFADWSMEVPLDVFAGSAKSGQSYLYWYRDALFQSHVSYVSEPDQWIVSPGYTDTKVRYTRVIRPACLECHITYIDLKRAPNVYHRDSAMWGISCERCHGPGRKHVEFHRDHPDESSAKQIVNPSDLVREQQLDICGQCHSGLFSLRGDAFSYRPGKDLDDYHALINPGFKGVGGIHTSNQLTRLKMSKCFQNSEMTCTTCHNPHRNERGEVSVFTKACLSCHKSAHESLSERLGKNVSENCIACHMPMGDTEGLTFRLSRGSFTVSMIDHYIRVDQKATDAHLQK